MRLALPLSFASQQHGMDDPQLSELDLFQLVVVYCCHQYLLMDLSLICVLRLVVLNFRPFFIVHL
jgi:hypothetical protein